MENKQENSELEIKSLSQGYKELSGSMEAIASSNVTIEELARTAKEIGDTESLESLNELRDENTKTLKKSIGESFTMISDQIEAIADSSLAVFNNIATKYSLVVEDVFAGNVDMEALDEEDANRLKIAIVSYRNVLQLQDPTEFRAFIMRQPKAYAYLGNYSALGRTHKTLRGFMRTSNLNLPLDRTLKIIKKYGANSKNIKDLSIVLELYMLYVLELKRTKLWTNNVIFISLFAAMITASATGNRKLAAQDGIIAAAKLAKVKQN